MTDSKLVWSNFFWRTVTIRYCRLMNFESFELIRDGDLGDQCYKHANYTLPDFTKIALSLEQDLRFIIFIIHHLAFTIMYHNLVLQMWSNAIVVSPFILQKFVLPFVLPGTFVTRIRYYNTGNLNTWVQLNPMIRFEYVLCSL